MIDQTKAMNNLNEKMKESVFNAYECKVCEWFYIGNIEMTDCIVCGAPKKEEQ